MDKLKKYASNTVLSNGNQFFFINADPEEKTTGLIFIKVYRGGTFNYVFAYSSILDSTFADGKKSRCNFICPKWTIHSLEAAVVDTCEPEKSEKSVFKKVLFGANEAVDIENRELLFSDPVELTAASGQYICLKTVFSGEKIPNHEESLVPKFVFRDGKWRSSVHIPVPVFTGIEASVKKRVGFIGDSITQGLGTEFNAYRYYSAYIADILGDEYAYWNLGIGYARGSDAATGGIWLKKAGYNDIVAVCFGVNDILQGHTADEIKKDILKIVTQLKSRDCTVILQTVPPFDYDRRNTVTWNSVNAYIKTELNTVADEIFDTVPFLSADGSSPVSKFGSHPNGEGHLVWAKALAPVLKKYL
ncbi:MAG: SGNH/GDSL hydrolase family protein [Clostridia bacterium]|nr:SGNH/GDSL hydrolase family protein [Clostridia bacterium]